MVIQVDDNRVNYPGNDVTASFAFYFKTSNINWINVYIDEVLTTLNYEVILNADQDTQPGGVINFLDPAPAGVPATGEILTIERVATLDQDIDYTSYDPFPSETHEGGLDKLTLITQQLNDAINRALVAGVSVPIGTSYTLPAPIANFFLAWNTAGTDLVNVNVADLSAYIVTSFTETLLDDADADEYWATLMASIDKNVARDSLEVDKETHTQIRNVSGNTLINGTPVYSTGYNSGQDRVTVAPADANDPTKMPAIGIVHGDILNNANGNAVAIGIVEDIDTSAWAVGDSLYISETIGELTNVRPMNANAEVQKVAEVLRSHAVNGRILAFGAGRSDDIPNGTIELASPTGTTESYYGEFAPTGWLFCDQVEEDATTYETLFDVLLWIQDSNGLGLPTAIGTCTFANGTDEVTLTSHGLSSNDVVHLSNSGGALPAELAAKTKYYVIYVSTNIFQLEATIGGGAIDFTDDGTGTHSVHEVFKKPDLRGRIPLGADNMGGASANRVTATEADNIGQTSGAENHSLSSGENGSHTHNAPLGSSGSGASAAARTNDNSPSYMTITSSGSGTAHNNMQPYLTSNYIIKT